MFYIGILEERFRLDEPGTIWSTVFPAGVMVADAKKAMYTSKMNYYFSGTF